MYRRLHRITQPYHATWVRAGYPVSEDLSGNENSVYLLARKSELFRKIGTKMEPVRFRQHFAHEMAQFASHCWCLEENCSYGWIERVSVANHSAYDLKSP